MVKGEGREGRDFWFFSVESDGMVFLSGLWLQEWADFGFFEMSSLGFKAWDSVFIFS